MNFTLGLRVGELVALKKEDFSEKVVHIQRQEVKKYIHDESGAVKRDGYEVVWYTKTRESIANCTYQQCKDIFKLICQINEQKGFCSEYLLLNAQGERMHNDAINNTHAESIKKLKHHKKGNHSIRKRISI